MKNKILIFVVGLFVGVTVGVLFSVAIKTLLGQFKELHISLNRINLKQSQLSQRLDSIQGKLVPDTKKPNALPTPATTKTTTPAKNTTGAENAKSQNVRTANTAAANEAEDSDIVVMTNQLVTVISAPLKNKDSASVNKKNVETDSTLASMSDISSATEKLNYRIEFWKSPLNYKGYKMSRGKIVLYGMNPAASANLILQDDTYYLVINQNVYKVEYTDDYKPFEKITDKTILKKLGV